MNIETQMTAYVVHCICNEIPRRIGSLFTRHFECKKFEARDIVVVQLAMLAQLLLK
jgi:hypothetical protein